MDRVLRDKWKKQWRHLKYQKYIYLRQIWKISYCSMTVRHTSRKKARIKYAYVKIF
jgi:hypothetical protein